MGQSTPKGKVTDNFRKRVEELEKRAMEMATHFKNYSSSRKWHTPEDLKTNLLDVPNLHEPVWNRDEANQIYCESVVTQDNPGTAGDIIAMKQQIDFMAVEERAFRLRHASIVRCATMAHSRLVGHGTPNYGVFSMLKTAVDNRLQAGSDPGAFTGDINPGAGAGIA
jgi:hypothetical protein